MKLFLLLSIPAFLTACGSSSSSTNSIEVTGSASLKVVPDMVEISLRADNVKPAMKDAVAQTQSDIAEIMAVCKKFVSDPSDIKVSTISTNKNYEYVNNREQFTGYSAAQVLEVSLKNITRIEEFTEQLLSTRISKITNIRYNHTKADSIMREVNLIALDDARQTAQKMCSKMDAQLGGITYLSNFSPSGQSERGPHYASSDYEMNLYNKSFGGRGFKMSTEILEFTDVAYARFELK